MIIFITGNSRSGTTMMSRILGNNKHVFSFQELHFFDEILPPRNPEGNADKNTAVVLFARLCAIQREGYFTQGDPGRYFDEAATFIETRKPGSYQEVFRQFLYSETTRNGRQIPCEQTPQNIFSLDVILNHIPEAKVIVMVRDPREVLLSQKFKWRRRKFSGGKIPLRESIRSRVNYHPVTISRIWNSVMQTAEKFKDHPAVLFVKYEELLLDPEKVIRQVCRHTGIEFTSEMTHIPVVGSSNTADAPGQKGIDSSRGGNWKAGGLNNTEIYICQEITENWMKRYGYSKANIHASWFSVAGYYFILPFQLATAVLFNMRRLRNPLSVLRRFRNNS